MFMFLLMEVITLSEKVKVVEIGTLIEIPSDLLVCQPLVSCSSVFLVAFNIHCG